MGFRLLSDKNRPVHLGPYPLERLARVEAGIEAYQGLISAEQYQARLLKGERDHLNVYPETHPCYAFRSLRLNA